MLVAESCEHARPFFSHSACCACNESREITQNSIRSGCARGGGARDASHDAARRRTPHAPDQCTGNENCYEIPPPWPERWYVGLISLCSSTLWSRSARCSFGRSFFLSPLLRCVVLTADAKHSRPRLLHIEHAWMLFLARPCSGVAQRGKSIIKMCVKKITLLLNLKSIYRYSI